MGGDTIQIEISRVILLTWQKLFYNTPRSKTKEVRDFSLKSVMEKHILCDIMTVSVVILFNLHA